MSNFDLLHPALQHHIVNSLGWRELRPFQEDVIPRVLSGNHQIILAPTAGGKTEASIFPTLSRMLSEDWRGLSVLYLCPIKALLNNLNTRLGRYFQLLGRESAMWHGDVGQGERKRILREKPDCLLTTPESLEVMLVSQRVDKSELFADLRVVIVDEIHAFAGDDRGWHLLSVLERASRFAGRELQRIGLSATVGNPEELGDWLAGNSALEKQLYVPEPTRENPPDVQVDYVGSLPNAALVISRLHRGEKRLVFVDSRSKAEKLGKDLRDRDVTTFVTHSSLSQDQRKTAEEAFASRSDCVIVATSVLELGVDVGDLDRVIQLDSPGSVSSFLQRMGRSGRREGTNRNCLFLATNEESLVRATAMLDLWQSGYVEPAIPPALPCHILAQQLMALALQQRGIGRSQWFSWVSGVQGFSGMEPEIVDSLVHHMLDEGILTETDGLIWFGREGEDEYGRRNFMNLFSVFMTPPLFTILHGRMEVGFVDQMSFMARKKDGEPNVLLLGGRAWKVTHIDWNRKRAYVEPTTAGGNVRWMGGGQATSFQMAQSTKKVLANDDDREYWSARAREQVQSIRMEYHWLKQSSTCFVNGPGNSYEWWLFGGTFANTSIASELERQTGHEIKQVDAFKIKLPGDIPIADLGSIHSDLSQVDSSSMRPQIDPKALDGLKFSSCLSQAMAIRLLQERMLDPIGVDSVLKQTCRIIATQPEE